MNKLLININKRLLKLVKKHKVKERKIIKERINRLKSKRA